MRYILLRDDDGNSKGVVELPDEKAESIFHLPFELRKFIHSTIKRLNLEEVKEDIAERKAQGEDVSALGIEANYMMLTTDGETYVVVFFPVYEKEPHMLMDKDTKQLSNKYNCVAYMQLKVEISTLDTLIENNEEEI